MSKAEGIYLSTDYRVTQGGSVVDDASTKYLTVTYPPDQGGPVATLTYTGLAKFPDGTPTGVWLRETLRGETEVFDRSMAHLHDRLNRDVRGIAELIINVVVLAGERRLLGGFTNIWSDSPDKPWKMRDSFEYVLQELTEPLAFANGSGARRVFADGHFDRMKSQLSVAPRRAHDHMNLLATINRRVAAVDDTVSPFCHVSFVSTNERYPSGSKVFLEGGETVPFEMPVLIFGIDLTDMARRFHERAQAIFRGETPPDDLDPQAINQGLKRRP